MKIIFFLSSLLSKLNKDTLLLGGPWMANNLRILVVSTASLVLHTGLTAIFENLSGFHCTLRKCEFESAPEPGIQGTKNLSRIHNINFASVQCFINFPV